MYPTETIEKARSLQLFSVDPDTIEGLQCKKYQLRGMEIIPYATGDEFNALEVRWVEDKHSWVLPLPPLSSSLPGPSFGAIATTPSLPTDPPSVTTWSFETIPEVSNKIFFNPVTIHDSFVRLHFVMATPQLIDDTNKIIKLSDDWKKVQKEFQSYYGYVAVNFGEPVSQQGTVLEEKFR